MKKRNEEIIDEISCLLLDLQLIAKEEVFDDIENKLKSLKLCPAYNEPLWKDLKKRHLSTFSKKKETNSE